MKLPLPQTVKQLSGIINGRFIGDPDLLVTGINEIHMVEKGDLTFVDHPKYYDKALNSNATTILINKEVEPPAGKGLIISDKPFDDYVFLVKKFRPFVTSTTSVSPSAEIGEGTIIQPGAFIGNHVKIGNDCLIHSNVSIYDHCIIGNNVIIHAGSVIGADAYYYQRRPEGYKKLESCGRVILEDNVEIGALCSIDKGVSGDTIISFGTKFDNHVQVGHDTYIGRNCLIGAHSAIAGVTRIEDDVIIWANVLVNKDLVIGSKAILLATTGVDKSIEGGKTYYDAPAREARKYWKEKAIIKQMIEEYQKKK